MKPNVTPRSPRVVAPSLVVLLAALCLGLGPASNPTSRPTSRPTADADPSPEQLAFARQPISYFNAKCANCHGDYGNFWGEGFAADKTDRQLREAVDEMCAGPAQAKLDGLALDSQVAYNRSLKTKAPFATVYAGDDGTLRGEVTPEARVTLVAADGTGAPAKVDGHSWTSDAQAASAVRVEKDGKTMTLDLADDAKLAFPGPSTKPATKPATEPAATRPAA